jgi:amidohydrolase
MVLISINEYSKLIENEIIYWRRELHKIPELNNELPKTVKYILNQLEKMGIEAKKLSSSGIVGLIRGNKPGKTIAIRADMDGLPIKEDTGLFFASTNDNMHACGHDAHVAMLLGAAKILKRYEENISGNVKLLFQPAEEKDGGAKPMIEEGVMENPHVDAVFGQHTGNLFKDIKNGQIGICHGNMMASQDHFIIKIKGKGSHGAYPASGVDPIAISANVITALQTLVSRETNGTDSAVLTIGRINGGKTYNIIPSEVEIEGTVRTLNKKNRVKYEKRIKEIVEGITMTMRGSCEIEYVHGYPPVINNIEFTDFLTKSAAKVVGEKNVVEIKAPSMGSEDMAYFLEKVPGTYFFLASIPKGIVYPHHNSKFDIDESVLWKGTAVLAQTAIDWLKYHK